MTSTEPVAAATIAAEIMRRRSSVGSSAGTIGGATRTTLSALADAEG